MDISKLPKFRRITRDELKAPKGTRVGALVKVDTFGGKGRARYAGVCVGCNRDLFVDTTRPERLSLGVNVFCLYDEFPDVPVCFECQSERELYDALCAARPFRFKVDAEARKLGAIGIPGPISDTVKAANAEEATDVFRAKWCETHEHIHILPGWVKQVA